MFEATLYFDKSVTYNDPIEHILAEFSKLQAKTFRIKQIERSDLRSEELVIEDIRIIKPQSRGSVVAKGGSALPISGSKKLNLKNTPVIVVRERKKPVYVFPCRIGERYYSIRDGLSFLREDLPKRVELQGEMEDSLVKMVLDRPEELEEGLVVDDFEHETPTGTTDVVLRDAMGGFLVIEAEREATDSTVGQILRLSAGFENNHGLTFNSVRAGVACYRISPNVLLACKRAGIAVWMYDRKLSKFARTVS